MLLKLNKKRFAFKTKNNILEKIIKLYMKFAFYHEIKKVGQIKMIIPLNEK